MYELIQAGEKSWYIKNPANVGVYSLGGPTFTENLEVHKSTHQ